MADERRPGMDHDHYDWSPLNATRAMLEWPDRARVALCVIVVLEHAEWKQPPGSYQVPNLAGGYGWGQFPDVTAWSHREYGHRVGVFRVLDALAKHDIKPTVAMDALTAEHYPFLVRHCVQRGCEFIAHGISVNRMITSRMSEAEACAYIRASIDAVARATGRQPIGWLGPVEAVSAQLWPGVSVVPTMAAGATDGRFTINAGIPTYGISGIFHDPGGSGVHGLNERIRVRSVYEGHEFLYRLVKLYAGGK